MIYFKLLHCLSHVKNKFAVQVERLVILRAKQDTQIENLNKLFNSFVWSGVRQCVWSVLDASKMKFADNMASWFLGPGDSWFNSF